jgi:hypothetical protein
LSDGGSGRQSPIDFNATLEAHVEKIFWAWLVLSLTACVGHISGHMLIETYLDGARGGRETVKGMIMAALDTVLPPKTKGANGFFHGHADVEWYGRR